MKWEETINSSTWENSIMDFMKRSKQPKLLDISVTVSQQKLPGEQTILLLSLIDGRLMKIKDMGRMTTLISVSMGIFEVVAIESMERYILLGLEIT